MSSTQGASASTETRHGVVENFAWFVVVAIVLSIIIFAIGIGFFVRSLTRSRLADTEGTRETGGLLSVWHLLIAYLGVPSGRVLAIFDVYVLFYVLL